MTTGATNSRINFKKECSVGFPKRFPHVLLILGVFDPASVTTKSYAVFCSWILLLTLWLSGEVCVI